MRPEDFSALIDQYQNLVLTICYRMTGDYFAAQDLTQETFLAAWKHLDELMGETAKAWLCRVAANRCVDHLRRCDRKVASLEEAYPPEAAAPAADPVRGILDQELGQELLANCRRLRSPYDEVARLYFHEELSPRQIALTRNIPLKTAQTQIRRAREMLRHIYREGGQRYAKRQ